MPRLSILAAIFVALAAPVAGGEKPIRKVLLLLVDDWGWTDAGCLGSDLYETPNIDRLAAEGVRFSQAYSACTVCSPTRAAILTGMHPARLRVTDFIDGHSDRYRNPPVLIPDWTMRLEHRHVTIAESLREAGFRTVHIGKWHLTPTGDEIERRLYWPEHHGFEINVAGNRWGLPGSYFWPYQRPGRIELWNMPPGEEGDYLTDALTEEALKVLDYFKDQPLFLYLPYYTVHTPIEGRPDLVAEFEGKVREGARHRSAGYAAMVKSLDLSVGRILDRLEALGIADETAVFLTGDNGGLDNGRGKPTENAPLREGKGSAYEGGVRVPGFARVPGLTPAGAVCEEPVISHDWPVTILDLLGVEAPAGQPRDGVSLRPLLADPASELEREPLYWHYPHYHTQGAVPYSAIREGDWRLVEFHTDGRLELYDLAADPGETHDLAAEEPERAAAMRERLRGLLGSVEAQMPTPNPDYDPEAPGGFPGR